MAEQGRAVPVLLRTGARKEGVVVPNPAEGRDRMSKNDATTPQQNRMRLSRRARIAAGLVAEAGSAVPMIRDRVTGYAVSARATAVAGASASRRMRLPFGVVFAGLLGAAYALAGGAPASADAIRDQQWYLSALGVPAVHASSQGNGVTVALLDTGVDPNQPDLAGSVVEGFDAQTNSGNGQQDTDGHGTGMAAIVAGHGHGPGNGAGVLGIAPRAKIMPIRLSSGRPGDPFAADVVARAIDGAVQRGAKVISASIGTFPSESVRQAVLRALDRDVVFVAAVGNIRNGLEVIEAPALFPGVLGICGTDRSGNHASFSPAGEGLSRPAFCAPAVDGVSANPGGGYSTGRSGTSMSAAIAAGAAALIRSKYPSMPAYEVAHRLTASAIDKGDPGVDKLYGHGLLNLDAALNGTITPTTSPTPWIKRSASPSTAASPSPSAGDSAAGDGDGAEKGLSAGTVAAGFGVAVLLLAAVAFPFVMRRRRTAGP